MSVCGIGIDVCGIARVERSLTRHGERFAAKILDEEELVLWRKKGDKPASLAGRFAVKEACFKALGSPPTILFREVKVRSDKLGRPDLSFVGTAREAAESLGVTSSFASITHDAGVAAAVVVLLGGPSAVVQG